MTSFEKGLVMNQDGKGLVDDTAQLSDGGQLIQNVASQNVPQFDDEEIKFDHSEKVEPNDEPTQLREMDMVSRPAESAYEDAASENSSAMAMSTGGCKKKRQQKILARVSSSARISDKFSNFSGAAAATEDEEIGAAAESKRLVDKVVKNRRAGGRPQTKYDNYREKTLTNIARLEQQALKAK